MVKAKKTGKTAPKGATQSEPFFRPFLKLDPRAGKKKGKAGAAAPKEVAPAVKPAPAPAPPATTRSEAETFALYMAGVRAIEGGATRIPATASGIERAEKGAAPKDDPDAGARAQMGSLVLDGIRFETTDDGERIEGRRLDVDAREVRRLRRAEYAIDGKLDLHGLGVDAARLAVEAFVKKRATDGDKVVLIVHGKGTHSPRQMGVLRGEIGAWLSQGRASRYIRAFATAPNDEGGGGAVLVLLAR